MKIDQKMITVVFAAAVIAGVSGCGGGSSPEQPPEVADATPAYAEMVEVNDTIARKVVDLFVDTGMATNVAIEPEPPYDIEKVEFGLTSLWESLFSKIKIKVIDKKVRADAFPAGVSTSGPVELNLTMDCAYTGSYTLYYKSEDIGTGAATQSSRFTEVTFNDCVHNTPILESIVNTFSTGMEKYAYTGGLSYLVFTQEISEDIKQTLSVVAKGLTEEYSEDDVKQYSFAMNGTADLEMINSGRYISQFLFSMNGTGEEKEYNSTSGAFDSGFSFDAKSASFSMREDRTTIFNGVVMLDGYIGVTESNTTGELTEYLYAEDLLVTKDKENVGSSTITTRTLNGVVGTSCLAGAVDLETNISWETNASMNDVAGNSNTTPSVGKTTIKGDSSEAVLQFGVEAGQSYGTITVDGGTPSDKQSLKDIGKDCDFL